MTTRNIQIGRRPLLVVDTEAASKLNVPVLRLQETKRVLCTNDATETDPTATERARPKVVAENRTEVAN